MADAVVKVTLPEMGESVTEGSIVEWRKRVGDQVNEGDTLVDVTTDKVDVEVPATAAGVITQLFGKEGDTVAVGAPLAEIDTSKSSNGAVAAAAPPTTNGAAAASAPASAAPSAPKAAPEVVIPSEAPRSRGTAEIIASPQARRVANKLELDLSSIRGSGPNGLILRSDVSAQANGAQRLRHAEVQPEGLPRNTSAPVPAGAKVTPLKGPAAALTGYMEQSLTIPTATSFRTLAVDVLDARRKELNNAVKAAGRSEKVSFTHIIAYAMVRAAAEMPFITYSFRRDASGAPQRLEPGIHLGLAVDAERKDGSRFLIVPVIKNADALDFARFYSKYEDLVTKARDNKLGADDLQGASFTLTNPGGIGTIASVPRLMAGQGAILATGAIGYPPGFTNAAEGALRSLGVGKVMTDDEHLRPSRDSRRAVGRILTPYRSALARRGQLLRDGVCAIRCEGG